MPNLDEAEIIAWGMANGWREVRGTISLIKPQPPKEAIARPLFKATAGTFQAKKPSGTWDKTDPTAYAEIKADEENWLPQRLEM
jgi:hypothetical protein